MTCDQRATSKRVREWGLVQRRLALSKTWAELKKAIETELSVTNGRSRSATMMMQMMQCLPIAGLPMMMMMQCLPTAALPVMMMMQRLPTARLRQWTPKMPAAAAITATRRKHSQQPAGRGLGDPSVSAVYPLSCERPRTARAFTPLGSPPPREDWQRCEEVEQSTTSVLLSALLSELREDDPDTDVGGGDAEVLAPEDARVVRELKETYPETFSAELTRLPPLRKVNFSVDLIDDKPLPHECLIPCLRSERRGCPAQRYG